MDAYRLPNGNILVPVRPEGEGLTGDAVEEIGPSDPRYQEWEQYYAAQGLEVPPLPPEPPLAD